ncbi:leucine-rich repeats and immunoglobulin-like domains protein 3 [Euwallacea similis]|uniref:leucine-rich repeats and immunoglobulin-like domains protein 3 n=1 Tax=Euwallacea similis TaxID=1736056 RepID=UPI00344BEC93
MVGVCFWVSYIVLISSSMSLAKSKCVKGCRCLDTYIDCDSKGFKTIPKNIPDWAEHLEINRNKLTQIEALTFQNLEHLLVLKLRRNQIGTLKDGAFYGLKHIQKLLLDSNYVTVISKSWLYGLESLRKLSLSHNSISQIHDDAWEFCSNLTVLDLSFNKLDSLTEDTFKNLNILQKLVLSNNNIAIIRDKAFMHLPKLKTLYFNYNRISWTIEDAKGAFVGLGELTKFNLVGNNIKSINSEAFLGLKNVVLINLDKNNITSIHNNTFSKVPNLKKLIINTSSMLCDCNLIWFLEWLNGKNLNIYASCAYPDWLKGSLITNVSLSNLTCDEVLKPRLLEEPAGKIMALKGESVILNCKARSSTTSNMTFIWKKDNIELPNANVIVKSSIDPDGKSMESISELKLLAVEHSHAGKYQCVISNNYGITYSQQSTIAVLVFPTLLKKPKNVEVEAGETVKLECAATGEPPPVIAWHKDGGNDFPAARERRMHVLHGDDTFFIINSGLSDSGVYNCTAYNLAGTVSAEAHVEILQKPQLANTLEDRELASGEPIVLKCTAQGVPKPTVTWFKDGEPIVPTERHFFIAENQRVIIVDAVHNDSGIYECHVNNSRGGVIGRSRIVIKPNVIDTNNMMGIIIISVVCCAVFTSIVWVAIIYHTRKPSKPKETAGFPGTELTEIQADCASERSSCKDSGTGDSARRSSDDFPEFNTLLHCPRSDHDRPIHHIESTETGD